jgi:acyl-CoA dehydrogenase
MQAATDPDPDKRLRDFDTNLFGHIGFAISNAVRSFWYGATFAKIGSAPGDANTKRYFRKLNRYSANLALLADTSMLLLGGKLKFKEKLSGRLGDVLSQLYIASAMLKRFEEDGRPLTEQPLLAWAFHDSVHKIELAMSAVLRNFPVRWAAWILWQLVFPWGRRAQAPSDRLGHRAAALLMTPCDARDRLADGVYLTPGPNNPAGRINASLATVILAEPVERKFLKALKNSDIEALTFPEQLSEGVREGWITADERMQLEQLRELTWDAIMVDDFDAHELEAASLHRLQQVFRTADAA